jgi:hypothetical protein
MDNTAPTNPTNQCRRSSDTTFRWLPKRLAKFCEAAKDAAPNVTNSAGIGSEEFDPQTLVDKKIEKKTSPKKIPTTTTNGPRSTIIMMSLMVLLSMVSIVHAGPPTPPLEPVQTTVNLIGHDHTPIVVLDNVLPKAAYVTLRGHLRSRTDFFKDHAHHAPFPGKIAPLNRAIVNPLLDAVQRS